MFLVIVETYDLDEALVVAHELHPELPQNRTVLLAIAFTG